MRSISSLKHGDKVKVLRLSAKNYLRYATTALALADAKLTVPTCDVICRFPPPCSSVKLKLVSNDSKRALFINFNTCVSCILVRHLSHKL